MREGAGGFDVKKQITTPSSFQSDQPAPVKGVETSIDEGNALQQQLDSPVLIASRDDVLKACVTTSGGLAFAGLVIRQVNLSHALNMLRFILQGHSVL